MQSAQIIILTGIVWGYALSGPALPQETDGLSAELSLKQQPIQNTFTTEQLRTRSGRRQLHLSDWRNAHHDLCADRITAALDTGVFADLFGRPVSVVDIKEVGDTYVLLKPQILAVNDITGEPIDLQIAGDPDEIFAMLDNDPQVIILKYSYWERASSGAIRDASLNVAVRLSHPPGSPEWTDELWDKINAEGTRVAIRLLNTGVAVLDSAKQITVVDESGHRRRLIYKPFDPVTSEQAGQHLLQLLGYPHTYTLHLRHDRMGTFAWIDYITPAPAAEHSLRIISTEAQARMLGRLLPFFYILGFADATVDNLYVTDTGAIVPLDLEALFSEDFFSTFEEFETAYRTYRGNDFFSGNAVRLQRLSEPAYQQIYRQGIAESIRIIAARKTELLSTVSSLLAAPNFRTRLLLSNASDYDDISSLHSVIPLYSISPGFIRSAKDMALDVAARIDRVRTALSETSGRYYQPEPVSDPLAESI